MSNEANERYSFNGLLRSQYLDCLKAGRSPKTGRRVRTSATSPLEIKCKKTNWAKLQVKGAAIGMMQAIREMNLRESDNLELVKQIRALETKMLNQLTAGYESFRFEYWHDQASKKK